MFDIPFSELFIIAIVALVVLGPKHLPEVARTAGRFVKRVRRFIDDARQELGGELSGGHLDEFRALRDELAETKRWAEQSSREAWTSLTSETPELPPPSQQPPRARRRRRKRTPTVKKPDGADNKASG